MSIDIEGQDNRIQRRRTLKKAVASYDDQSISMEVVVRDISDTGARLKLKENSVLPNQFQLYIEIDGIRVDCEVVWRRGLEVGAKFASEVKSKVPLRSQTLEPTHVGERKVSILRKKPIHL